MCQGVKAPPRLSSGVKEIAEVWQITALTLREQALTFAEKDRGWPWDRGFWPWLEKNKNNDVSKGGSTYHYINNGGLLTFKRKEKMDNLGRKGCS